MPVLERLAAHRHVLETLGVGDLAQVPSLRLPNGFVAPQPGLTVHDPNLVTGSMSVGSVGRFADGRWEDVIAGSAGRLKAKPFPHPLPLGVERPLHLLRQVAHDSLTFEVPGAYWIGRTIEIPDDTTVVVPDSLKWITCITPKLTIGANVTFTYARVAAPVGEDGARGADGAVGEDGSYPDGTLDGQPGAHGDHGRLGNPGSNGEHGPVIEIWTLDMKGKPAFDVRGQAGGLGGVGGRGGDGGHGGRGRDGVPVWIGPVKVDCKSGPGSGGAGGTGGNGGRGGDGGLGGDGGKVILCAPQPVINAYIRGFTARIDPGASGAGGQGGARGARGAGGHRGNDNDCPPAQPRNPGPEGAEGVAGEPGATPGERKPGELAFAVVTPNQFNQQLTKPAIFNLEPRRARQGETVTVHGARFRADDVVLIGNVKGKVTPLGESTKAVIVPAVTGGNQPVVVRRADGRKSNAGTLHVYPTLAPLQQGTRVRPGQRVTLRGTGFSPASRVLIDGEAARNVKFVDTSTLVFTAHRPPKPRGGAHGERVDVLVQSADGIDRSNTIDMILETYRIVSIGESLMWGQGLTHDEKMSSLVVARAQAALAGMAVYHEMKAHSGAIIGYNADGSEDEASLPPICGEAPTDYPSMLQQSRDVAEPDTVDLVLVAGGINDVDVRNVISPIAPTVLIDMLSQQACYGHMKRLLTSVANDFPNAQIVVLGYFPILSGDSDLILVDLLAAALLVITHHPWTLELRMRMVANAQQFLKSSNRDLRKAVAEVNSEEAGGRIRFVSPKFTPRNACFGPAAWLWGIGADLSPRDLRVRTQRAACCEENPTRVEMEICKRASVGHPTSSGAKAYADAILNAISWNTRQRAGQTALAAPADAPAGRAPVGAAPRTELVSRVGRVAVRRVVGGLPFFFTSGMTIDADGAPKAYHRDDARALDFLANAGHPGDWWGIVTDRRGNPVVQSSSDPAPGYYVSTTSLADRRKRPTDPRRYVDSESVSFVALPEAVLEKGRARVGDLATVWNRRNNRVSHAIVADVGPPDHIGEGSIALARALAIPRDPKRGGQASDVVYLVFPRSGNRRPRAPAEINAVTVELLRAWGGVERLGRLVPPRARNRRGARSRPEQSGAR